jgi:serine/threonine protein phosphatase 1
MAKRWVVPDIHGCAETLQMLIEDLIRPQQGDKLYFLGDYIDRGPDSKTVLDYLMKLETMDFETRFLMGNHEDYLLRAYDYDLKPDRILGLKKKNRVKKEWLFHGGKKAMESFGAKNLIDIPKKYIDWMRQLDYYVELDHFILVHAGLNFKNEDPFEDTNSMIWVRDYEVKPEMIKNKKIVHGHVPVSLEFIDNSLKNHAQYDFLDLDNGTYMSRRSGYGNLIALELDSMEYVVQHNVDF